MNMFINSDVREATMGVNQQLKRYYTACHNARNTMPAVEQHITLRLLPKIEEMVMNDALEGGKHKIKYLEHNNQRVLFAGDSAFCNYQGAKGILMEKFHCPLEGNFDMIEEGKKTLQMIDDLENMSASQFKKKYYTPFDFNGVEKLVSAIENAYDPATFETSGTTFKALVGSFELDKKMMMSLAQFCNANPDSFTTEYKNGTLHLFDIPVAKAAVEIVARHDNFEDDLCVRQVEFTFTPNPDDTLYGFPLSDYKPERYSFKVNLKPEQGEHLGKVLTETYYKPFCVERWRKDFEKSGKPFPPVIQKPIKKPTKGTDYNAR